MNNKKVVAFSMSALVIAVIAQLWMTDSENKEMSSKNAESDAIPTAKSDVALGNSQSPFTRQTHPGSSTDEVWITEGMKQQMIDVAEAYQENMRYPAYSTPLQASDWSLLNPRPFVPKLVELDIDGLSAEIVLEQYVVLRDQDLPVRVNLRGVESLGSDVSEVRFSLGNESATVVRSFTESEGVLTYSGIISAEQLSKHNDVEVPLNATISLDSGEQTQISAAFKLAASEAELTHLGSSYVEGSDLNIPAYFKVSTDGFYRIRANLFDEESNTPISHINASFMLSETENEGVLKVHASALRNKGFEGPYILKDFDITRGPAKPGDKTGYGASNKEEFSVQGFDLDSYSHEPYHDPKSQQRLEFLQKMAGVE